MKMFCFFFLIFILYNTYFQHFFSADDSYEMSSIIVSEKW